jgi:hypothetical protein
MRTPTFSEFTRDRRRQNEQNAPVEIVEEQPQENMMMPVPQQQQDRRQMPANVPRGEVNPFNEQKYNNVMFPDVPLSYGGSVADSLLNDNEVPEDTRIKYWWVFHKDNTLTFLDEERKKSKLLNFDIAKIDILNTVPYYDYTFEKELDFTVLRNVFETKLDRALGFKGSAQKNERIILQSQFSEQRQISESSGDTGKEGFFKRLLGRR